MKFKTLNIKKELTQLGVDDSKINTLIDLFNKYETNNLDKIKKLNRVRLIEHNRIKGGLKQTINAHGSIDKKLIGSATKRIYGALIDNGNSYKIDTFSFISGLVVSLAVIIIFKLIYLFVYL
jgi:hypothetical protein